MVAVGWVPYRFGQWVWQRPWGWTWVDDAPWGFAPFHYGRWLWWGGRWCWTPGPRVPRPVFAPALVGWVGGGGAQVVIGSRPAPVVGWVPLGPREAYRPGYHASARYLDRINGGAHAHHGHGHGNRAVPGAVTVVPAQALRPRHPVAHLHHDRVVQYWLQRESFRHQPPGRPPFGTPREQLPRDAGPVVGSPPQRPGRPPAAALPVMPGTMVATPQAVQPAPAPTAAPAPQRPPTAAPVMPGTLVVTPQAVMPPAPAAAPARAAAQRQPPAAAPNPRGRTEPAARRRARLRRRRPPP